MAPQKSGRPQPPPVRRPDTLTTPNFCVQDGGTARPESAQHLLRNPLGTKKAGLKSTRTGSTPPGATLAAGVVLRLGDHGLDRRRLAAPPCAAPRTLRRALAAPRSRSAMHAIDGVSRRRDRRAAIDGFAIDREISVCDRDFGPSHHAGQVVILIPGATAAVVLRSQASVSGRAAFRCFITAG